MKLSERNTRVARCNDLPVWGRGVLPSGILCWRSIRQDVYTGTKDNLLAAGFARPEWFPRAPLPGKRPGSTKRSFYIDSPRGTISLRDLANGKWEICLPISEEERARRKAEEGAQCDREQRDRQQREDKEYADNREQEQRDDEQRLAALMRRLPPFAEGVSESEREHLRVLRALSDRSWETLLNIAELWLLSDDKRGTLAQPLRLAARLELVVDNSGGAHG